MAPYLLMEARSMFRSLAQAARPVMTEGEGLVESEIDPKRFGRMLARWLDADQPLTPRQRALDDPARAHLYA